MTLHTFGDSHAEWAFKEIAGVVTHPMYSKLCYSFGRLGIDMLNISDEKYEVRSTDSVLFLFGEIDCSCHVYKQAKLQNRNYKIIIEELVVKYINAIEINSKLISSLKIILCSLPPSVKVEEVFYEPNSDGEIWIKHRFLGTDKERLEYVNFFNSTLKTLALKNKYIYIDICTPYQTEHGFLNRKYSDTSIHIRDPIFIIELLKDFI